eukprot:PhM_4_TR2766/c0_g1_i1/m.89229
MVSNKTVLKSSKKAVDRLSRIYDGMNLHAHAACRLDPDSVLNVDRWRVYPPTHVYESVSKFFLNMPGDASKGVAHEVREFVEDELPYHVDMVFLLEYGSYHHQYYCRFVDKRLEKIHYKWTIAHKGVKFATELQHETERHDPHMTDWRRAYHTVGARQQQGFQSAPQNGASGSNKGKSTPKSQQ